nr:MAG TPA: hypothetical protein [Caudoviricetes sp.]
MRIAAYPMLNVSFVLRMYPSIACSLSASKRISQYR